MDSKQPITRVADHRQAGTLCPACQAEIKSADLIIVCSRCGAAHHEACWRQNGGCAAYACAPAQHRPDERFAPTIVINQDDLAQATTARMVSPAARLHSPTMPGQPAPSLPNAIRQPISRFAIVAFILSLLGVPFIGWLLFLPSLADTLPIHYGAVIFGLLAVLFGAISIGQIQIKRRRGTLFAVCGVFLGLGNMVGWILALAIGAQFGSHAANVQFSHSPPDLADVAAMTEPIQRAMRANVVVTSSGNWGVLSQALGSGVIVKVTHSRAYILTNRHVVDSAYRDGVTDSEVKPNTTAQVEMLGQGSREAMVHWYAPYGVDIALISTDILTDQAVAAKWRKYTPLQIGSDVFGIGNPSGQTWTHTKGSISQIRKQNTQGHTLPVIQTDAAISSGNSGGGLYDKQGYLIGINTWTTDKKVAEGISFAISLNGIMELHPPIPGDEEESP